MSMHMRMREQMKCSGDPAKDAAKRILIAVSGLMAIVSLVMLEGCASVKPVKQADAQYTTATEAAGIKIVRIHPSVGGQMLDMRYRLIDPEKAGRVMHQQAQVYLIDQASGMKLPVPTMAKVGRLMQRPEKTAEDKVFWVFFSNPGALVKTGAKVTLVIDGIRIEDIVVQ